MKVTNINYSGNHYLIHVFFKNFEGKEIHCYSKEQLDEKVTKLMKDEKVHDFYIYKGIDFDVE